MERRRFVPRPEGLEHRELLSTARPATAAVSTRNTLPVNPNDPNIGPLRQLRIDRLANYFQQIARDRTVPAELVSGLQDSLREIEGRLTAPPSAPLAAFNRQLRVTLSRSTLSVADAKALNNAFTKVLEKSKADPGATARFASRMNDLARLNAAGSNSAVRTAGDYALLAQLTMGVGIKITPTNPVPAGPRATR
jgi:hypothetical protein